MAIEPTMRLAWDRDSDIMSITPGTWGEIYVPEGPDSVLIDWNAVWSSDVYTSYYLSCRVDFAGDGTALLTLTYYFGGMTAGGAASIGVEGTPLVGPVGNSWGLPQSDTIAGLVAGDELILSAYNYFNHTVFYTGPPWRNPDGLRHAKVHGWLASGASGVFAF